MLIATGIFGILNMSILGLGFSIWAVLKYKSNLLMTMLVLFVLSFLVQGLMLGSIFSFEILTFGLLFPIATAIWIANLVIGILVILKRKTFVKR